MAHENTEQNQPHDYCHDAALISRFGSTIMRWFTAVNVSLGTLVVGADAIRGKEVMDNLVTLGKVTALGVVGMAGFEALSVIFENQSNRDSGQQGSDPVE